MLAFHAGRTQEGHLTLPEGFLEEKPLEKSLNHVSALPVKALDREGLPGRGFPMGKGTEVRSSLVWPMVWGCRNVVSNSGCQERGQEGQWVPATLCSILFCCSLGRVSLTYSFHYLTPLLKCDRGSRSLLSMAFKALLTVSRRVFPTPLKTHAPSSHVQEAAQMQPSPSHPW